MGQKFQRAAGIDHLPVFRFAFLQNYLRHFFPQLLNQKFSIFKSKLKSKMPVFIVSCNSRYVERANKRQYFSTEKCLVLSFILKSMQ